MGPALGRKNIHSTSIKDSMEKLDGTLPPKQNKQYDATN